MPDRKTSLWTIAGTVLTAAAVLISAVTCAERHADAADQQAASTLKAQLDAKLDVARYERDQVADSAWKAEVRAIVLDALCAKNVDPTNRRCAR